MTLIVASAIITSVFYFITIYITYIAAFILYNSVKYKIVKTSARIVAFITICYISIISDMVLFHSAMYYQIVIKNGLFTFIILFSLCTAKDRR